MSKLLINESPVMIIPSLAVRLGLNEAVVLQQIHYWVTSSSHVIEGRKWIYNTYKDWQKQLPFWSESTIKRTIRSLEAQGYLLSGNFNQLKIDKTKWYTIDYERLEALEPTESELSFAQTESSSSSACTMEDTSLNQAIPESTTEITSEKETPVVEIIHYLNEKTKAEYKPSTFDFSPWINPGDSFLNLHQSCLSAGASRSYCFSSSLRHVVNTTYRSPIIGTTPLPFLTPYAKQWELRELGDTLYLPI
ncbi:hypothetical protein [Neobacillus sp. 19]|uniref:hypothetical protein n=1 Tax=Neobacillus sp. 19 TaxID=3394458 RepID=UPI003BF702FE